MSKSIATTQLYLNGAAKNQTKYVLTDKILNLTAAQYKQNYYTITFAGALIASNVVNMKVNGNSLTPVTYNTSDNHTLDLLAAEIQASSGISYAARTATHVITVYPSNAAGLASLTDIVVTLGASQTTATVSGVLNTILTGSNVTMKQGTGAVKDVITCSDATSTLNTAINLLLQRDYDTNVVYTNWTTNGVTETRGIPVNAMYWFYDNIAAETCDVLWFDATNTEWILSSTGNYSAASLDSYINNID